MMIRSTRIFLFVLLFFFKGAVSAQDTLVFSSDPALFIAELEVHLKQAPARQRQAVATLISNLRQGFNTGMISAAHQRAMIETANVLHLQRFQPFPHFYSYFSSAMALLTHTHEHGKFLSWNNSVLKLAKLSDAEKLQAYIESSGLFFSKGILYSSNSIEWRMNNGAWTMAADSMPGFMIKGATLSCYASRDSISIFEATGMYTPATEQWAGTKGKINWDRAGFPADEVYAEFTDYILALNSSIIQLDSAWLHFPEYFSRPLHGSLRHRVVAGYRPATASYPHFSSYHLYLQVKDIFPGIDYMGGFSLEGNKVSGFGKNRENAQLTIRKGNEQIIRLNSHNFVIRDDRITAQRASFCLYYENDSVYHPGLQMRYLHQDRELILLRTGDGIAQSPFFNSYHHLDMTFEALYWTIGGETMTFGAMRGLSRQSEATFESANFYTPGRFNRIQGADARHPLIIVNEYAQQLNSGIFYHEDLATHMNIAISQVSALLISLANQGFLQYSPDDGKVVLKDRLNHYIDAVNDRSDYDVIRIQSKVDGIINARLNLNDFDLEIFGAPEVYLSNTQRVFIYPTDGLILMKKGLDFVFEGRINAGYFEFFAKECAFIYDDFRLNLTQIDSLSFDVPVQDDDATFREQLERVRTVISDISGDLLIDHPSNKSGRRKYPRYPIFDSKNDSYVYFDEPHVQDGVYKRDSFYYHILPFTIDSLTNFTTVGMSFNGYLYSGDIFPDIEEPLRVQPDFSLGFVKEFNDEGLPLYNGKAHAFLELSLSHQGLRGGGRIEYQTSVLYSDDFVLHPDSMMAMLYEFDLSETIGEVSHPAVYAKDVQQKWIVDDDRMVLRTTKNIPFEMYQNQLVHKGTLTYRSTGLYGSGELTFANATFRSTGFHFHHDHFGADKSMFALTSPAFGNVFKARSYGFTYDLSLRQGRFQKKEDSAIIEFPFNKYKAYMDIFRWETDYEEILLSNEHEQLFVAEQSFTEMQKNMAESLNVAFISVHPQQDSLQFAAGAARFDLREYVIEVQEVPYIEVADAAIQPVDGNVGILRDAEIKPLHGANLLVNTENHFHQLYNATATIQGRNEYSASGVYDYTDDAGKTQTVYFNRIELDSLGNTLGHAHISDLGFSLNPYFDFIGNIRLDARNKNFYFDGGFRIKHHCSESNPRWVRFQGEVDKHNVILPVYRPPVDVHGEELSSSLLFSPTGNKVYPAFLLGKQYPNDYPLYTAHGSVSFDAGTRQYIIGEISDEEEDPGEKDVLKLDIDRCLMSIEGPVTFGQEMGQVSMFTSGTIDHYIIPDSTVFKLFSVIDFFFDGNSLDVLNQSLITADLRGIDPGSVRFSNGLSRFLSESDAQRLLSELNLYGSFRRFPRELSKTMILDDLQLRWNPGTRSFTSFGPIGIVVLNNQLVNRYVDGHIELVRRRVGDALSIYLQPADNEWYFFTYSGGIMQAISSNEAFNEIILNLREDRRTLKTKGDEEPYQFIISTIEQRNAFLRRMRSN